MVLELPGILNWAIEGCLAWQKDGLDVPAVITAATNRYREEMDLLGHWIDQECTVGPHLSVSSKQLYENYRRWCEAVGVTASSNPVFIRKLDSRHFYHNHIRAGNIVTGIALNAGSVLMSLVA